MEQRSNAAIKPKLSQSSPEQVFCNLDGENRSRDARTENTAWKKSIGFTFAPDWRRTTYSLIGLIMYAESCQKTDLTDRVFRDIPLTNCKVFVMSTNYDYYDGDSEDNVASEMNLHFKYEPPGTWLKSFTLFFTVETIAKVKLEHGDKFETEINKISSD